jgi:hypothetical protein
MESGKNFKDGRRTITPNRPLAKKRIECLNEAKCPTPSGSGAGK